MTPGALAALHARVFTAPPPWREADFAAMLADPVVFLLVEGDAAFLLGRAVPGEAELLTLAVAPEARRRGLARGLVARFLYQARLRGAQAAFLEVASDNLPALALYRGAGFAPVGRRKGYATAPGLPAQDALVLSRAIRDATAR